MKHSSLVFVLKYYLALHAFCCILNNTQLRYKTFSQESIRIEINSKIEKTDILSPVTKCENLHIENIGKPNM